MIARRGETSDERYDGYNKDVQLVYFAVVVQQAVCWKPVSSSFIQQIVGVNLRH